MRGFVDCFVDWGIDEVKAMNWIVCIGKQEIMGGYNKENNRKTKRVNVFCHIQYEDDKLSISGVVGPKSDGNAWGGCGQIIIEGIDIIEFAQGWNKDKLNKFKIFWEKYHLNDMQAGCIHQRALEWDDWYIPFEEWPSKDRQRHVNSDSRGYMAGWVYPQEHPKGLLTKPCPVCGYKYGVSWQHLQVPQDVLRFMADLPLSDVKPAWI